MKAVFSTSLVVFVIILLQTTSSQHAPNSAWASDSFFQDGNLPTHQQLSRSPAVGSSQGINQLPNGQVFKGMGWVDGEGSVSHLKTVSNIYFPEECMDECASNRKSNSQGCVAFTFVETIKRCDLKSQTNAQSLKKQDSHRVMSAKCTSGCGRTGRTKPATGGKCFYECKNTGVCQVDFEANGAYSGGIRGSCTSEEFGWSGDCSGTPRFCRDCKHKCRGSWGTNFRELVGSENAGSGQNIPPPPPPRTTARPTTPRPTTPRTVPSSTECSIISGPGVIGSKCIFPFKYEGVTYRGCPVKKGERWCPTSVDPYGNFNPWNVGVCSENCPNYDYTEPSPECKKQGKRKRIRKSTSRLSNYEKSRLRHALESAIANQTKWMNFPDVANFHGAPYDVCPDRKNKGCCPHMSDNTPQSVKDFLPWHRLYLAQLEEVLDPYLADTNIGLPYWDWTEDSSVPDVWESINSPIKNHTHRDYSWQEKSWPWDKMLSNCINHDPIWGPQTHALRISKKDFEGEKRKHVRQRKRQFLRNADPLSSLLHNEIGDALQEESYVDFTKKINSAHAAIHITLKCTTAYPTTTAYDPAFWLHHGMVDKVFADWQGNPDNESPKLDTHRKIAPFGYTEFNKFTLTNQPPAKTLDFESNLCYCYNCDLEKRFSDIHLPDRTGQFLPGGQPEFFFVHIEQSLEAPAAHACFRPPSPPSVECQGVLIHKNTPKITISVGITVPNHIGLEVNYKICFGNANCEEGLISVFGNPGAFDKDLSISSEHFNVQEDTVKNEFDRWTSIEILEGKSLIPEKTPPFVIITFKDVAKHCTGVDEDKDLGKFVQLQKGAKKESYGDLLKDYKEVKNFCDTIDLDDRFLKLGDIDTCNLGSVCKSNFPISISHENDYDPPDYDY